MTGPATNAASFVTIWKVLGRRTAILYLAAVAGCALIFGIVLDLIAKGADFAVILKHHGWMMPPVVKYVSAVVLLAMLLYATFCKKRQPPEN